jgi:hypothetical protein
MHHRIIAQLEHFRTIPEVGYSEAMQGYWRNIATSFTDQAGRSFRLS